MGCLFVSSLSGVPVSGIAVSLILYIKLHCAHLGIACFLGVFTYSILDERIKPVAHNAKGADYLGIAVVRTYFLDELLIRFRIFHSLFIVALAVGVIVGAEVYNDNIRNEAVEIPFLVLNKEIAALASV